MMMKMIAIGILALLGLSSVMNPKAFRVFLGGLAALCMALFIGFAAIADRTGDASILGAGTTARLTAKIQRILGVQPNWQESASVTSQKLLDEAKQKRVEDSSGASSAQKPSDKDKSPERAQIRRPISPFRLVEIDRSSEEEERMSTVEKIRAVIAAYLEDHAEHSNDIGVTKLIPEDLGDWSRFLKVVPVGYQEGKLQLKFAFDEEFARYVRRRGKEIVMRERLQATTYGGVALCAALFLGYGILKVLNARKRHASDVDYLRASNVSMV